MDTEGSTNTEAQLLAKIVFEGDLEYSDTFTKEQKEFFNSSFPDISLVKTKKLHCTSCDKHLGSGTAGRTYVHPILQVLQCKSCLAFYNSGEFLQGEDGSELHCRWCGQGGQVYCCSKCPSVFCKSCVKRNLSKKAIKVIEDSDEWECFRCDTRPLWELQANCWALQNYMRREKRAVSRIDCTADRRRSACADHSSCCPQSAMKEDQSTSVGSTQYKTRKRRRVLKTDKTAMNHDDPNTKTAIKRARVGDLSFGGILSSDQEQAEVVCTPDIFPCFEDDPTPPTTPELSPRAAAGTTITALKQPVQNGTQSKTSTGGSSKPRISVRPPETMMQSPGQPMFPTMLPNRPILCQLPGSSLQSHSSTTSVAIPISMDVLASGNNVIQLNDGRLLSFNKPTQGSFSTVIPVPVSCISSTMPPPLVPPVQRNPPPMKIAPGASRGRGGSRYGGPQSVRAPHTKTMPSLTPTASSRAPKSSGSGDQTLSSTLQKKLQDNPNINRVRMRKIPDWFHVNVQSCLVIARTFISQLMDLQSKAQHMQDSSYDEVKNMHVQLSFLISAIIGKYKNNQHDLNLQLSEWTDALCKSLDNSLVDAAPAKAAAASVTTTPVISSVTSVAGKTQPNSAISAPAIVPPQQTAKKRRGGGDPGRECRTSHREIFRRFRHDRKLMMDPIVLVHKFKFQKSTNVFKVKPKYKPIIRTPATIDPNVVQTIDSDTDDDDDCTIVPGPDPLLIDLEADGENNVNDPAGNGKKTRNQKRADAQEDDNSENVDDPQPAVVVDETADVGKFANLSNEEIKDGSNTKVACKPAVIVDKSTDVGRSANLSNEKLKSKDESNTVAVCDTNAINADSAPDKSIVKANSTVETTSVKRSKIVDSPKTSSSVKAKNVESKSETATNTVTNSEDISHSNEPMTSSGKNETESVENIDLPCAKPDGDGVKKNPSIGDKIGCSDANEEVTVVVVVAEDDSKAPPDKTNAESIKIVAEEGVPKKATAEVVEGAVATKPEAEQPTEKSAASGSSASESVSGGLSDSEKDIPNCPADEPMDCDNDVVECVTDTDGTVAPTKTDEKIAIVDDSRDSGELNGNCDALVTSSE